MAARLFMLALLTLFTLPSHAAGASDTFRVVTLNLWHDKADWPRREAVIAATLKSLQPDVIVLQEVLQHAQLRNQAQTLGDAIGYRWRFFSADAADADRRYGNAILTRHAIRAESWRALRPLDDHRSAAHVRIAVGARLVDVFATHLHYTPEGVAIRREQIADLIAYVRDTSGPGPVIVAGDFNAPVDAPEMSPLLESWKSAYDVARPRALADAVAHSTLNPAFHPPLRVDHVLLDPRAFAVGDSERLFVAQSEGVWASDHFGVMATLRFVHAAPVSPVSPVLPCSGVMPAAVVGSAARRDAVRQAIGIFDASFPAVEGNAFRRDAFRHAARSDLPSAFLSKSFTRMRRASALNSAVCSSTKRTEGHHAERGCHDSPRSLDDLDACGPKSEARDPVPKYIAPDRAAHQRTRGRLPLNTAAAVALRPGHIVRARLGWRPFVITADIS